MTIAQAGYMAIYALQKVKGLVQGCGGKTEIFEIDDNPKVLPLASFEVQDVREIEADFEFFEQQLRPLLFAFCDLSESEGRKTYARTKKTCRCGRLPFEIAKEPKRPN
jgi:hypothetical protein